MNRYPSRSERRQDIFYAIAERGDFSAKKMLLYLSEIQKLLKEGFCILDMKPSRGSYGLYSVTIDWSHAYDEEGMPHMVYNYIHHTIETFPMNFVGNFAQELYVIAHRANTKK